MIDLLVLLIERTGTIVTIAFIMTRTKVFRNLVNREQLTWKTGLYTVLIFGTFGILGTYTGIPVTPGGFEIQRGYTLTSFEEALANSRVVGVFIGGLLGGPYVGLATGVFAGLHRYSIGGFTAFACAISTIAEGILGGYIGKKYNHGEIKPLIAFGAGVLAESMQMLIILLLAKPFLEAWALVKLIGLPMIFANSAGIAIFMIIIQSVLAEEERVGALYSQKVLRIANQSIGFLKAGLNYKSAQEVVKIIYDVTKLAAVAITNKDKILAHKGMGEDHHKPGDSILTEVTKEVIDTGEMVLAPDSATINCTHQECPLSSALIVPLKLRQETVGTLKLYFWPKHRIKENDLELGQGIADLFSTQLELALAEKQSKLLDKAEIRALQAQINPHFLFNSLNVIVSLVRTQPERARELLISLGDFFRQNLQSTERDLNSLEKEINHVKSYVAIEKARFGEKLQVTFAVDELAKMAQIPPLTLQPLVENAIKHGIYPKKEGGAVEIKAKLKGEKVEITVKDTGLGMEEERWQACIEGECTSASGMGIGLRNVYQRLIGHFGKESELRIVTKRDRGTEIVFYVPSGGAEHGD